MITVDVLLVLTVLLCAVSIMLIPYMMFIHGYRKIDDATFVYDHIAIQSAFKEQVDKDPIGEEMAIERLFSSKKKRIYRYTVRENQYYVSGDVKKDSKGFTNVKVTQKQGIISVYK